MNWKYGIRTAIAACICLALVRWFRLSQGYWACISAIVMVQSKAAETWAVARDRIAGTAIGALVGLAAAGIWNGHWWVYGLAILACMILPPVLQLKSGGGFAGVAASIILLVPNNLPHWKVAEGRFIEVGLGVLVSVAVSQTIWRDSSAQ